MGRHVLALLPVAFQRQPPFLRHYYLGLPGLAILFACAVRSWRSTAFATPMMAPVGRHAKFRFGVLKEPLDVNSWLTNNVNVVLARDGNFTDAVAAGLFPPAADSDLCALAGKLTGTESRCSIVFRGQPVIAANSNVVETPNNLPIFEVAGGLVTLSRTTIRTPALDGHRSSQDSFPENGANFDTLLRRLHSTTC